MCVCTLYKRARDKRMRSEVKEKGAWLQQVLLLALAAVVAIEEGLLHLAVFVQPARLVGEIGTYRTPRERATGRSEGGVRWRSVMITMATSSIRPLSARIIHFHTCD